MILNIPSNPAESAAGRPFHRLTGITTTVSVTDAYTEGLKYGTIVRHLQSVYLCMMGGRNDRNGSDPTFCPLIS